MDERKMRLRLGDGSLARIQAVGEKHRDGHGTDAARHGRDGARHLLNLGKVDVADQAIASLFGLIVHAVRTDVDDDGALLHPILLHHLRAPARRDDDVGFAADSLRIPRLRVHHGYGTIFLHQKHRRRHADDV